MDIIQDRYSDIKLTDKNLELVAKLWNWDLRNSLNTLESALMIAGEKKLLSDQDILSACEKQIYHDRDWEEHYNIISAIHKSLRDSDADAACYRIQRMLSWGEDPLYIARRMLRFASEDIWPGDNNALLLANQVYDAVAKIWMPECDVFLMQLAMYLAKAPKNNIAYMTAIKTKQDVDKFWNLAVPIHLRNAPTKFMKEIWYWVDYKYVHDDLSANDQKHFPDELKGRAYLK